MKFTNTTKFGAKIWLQNSIITKFVSKQEKYIYKKYTGKTFTFCMIIINYDKFVELRLSL